MFKGNSANVAIVDHIMQTEGGEEINVGLALGKPPEATGLIIRFSSKVTRHLFMLVSSVYFY